MKHPALTRVTAVALAVFCLVTLIAGGGGLWKAHGDHQEDLRQRQLLRDRTDRAAALSARLEELQEQYDLSAADLEELLREYETRSTDYRVELATYTATRAGIAMGRAALEQSSNMLWKSKKQLQDGMAQLSKWAAAFEEIYRIYLAARDAIQRGRAVYQEGLSYLESEESERINEMVDPQQVLAAVNLTRTGINTLGDVIRGLQDDPPDADEAAESMRRMRELAELASGQMGDVDPRAMAALAVQDTISRADEMIAARVEAGESEEAVRAEADAFCRTTLGMSYEEAKAWLLDNSAPQTGGQETFAALAEMDPEQMREMLETMSDELDLLQESLTILEEEEETLGAQEDAMRSDPEAMESSESLLTLLKTELDSADRILDVISRLIERVKRKLDALTAQLDRAMELIEEGIATVGRNRLKMAEMSKDLDRQHEEMLKKKWQLEHDGAKLALRQRIVDDFEATQKEFRSARAALMLYDGIADAVGEGADLLDSAEAELERMTQRQQHEFIWRLVIAALMLLSCVPCAFCVAGAFERPKMKRLWIPAALCAALGAAGEAASVWMGRGLWYSGLFLVITALAMLPLTIEKKT